MAGPARFPLTALLLSHCLDTGTSKAELKIWAEDPMALGSPLHLHCTFLGQEHVTLVSWWRVGPNRSREDLAVIHATHGAHLPPALRGLLQVTNVSDGRVGLTLPSLGPPDNGTRFCCKFSTFPSGVSEQCLDLLLPEPVPDSPGAPQAAVRAEVLGTLGAGAFFLLGSVVVLGHLVRARRRRTLLVSGPHPCLPNSQETPMALWVQQGLPGQRNSFSAPYVLINLDYFTPQPNATAHGGLLPPPLPPPRPGRARGQDPGQSRATHGGAGARGAGPRLPTQDVTLATCPSGLGAA